MKGSSETHVTSSGYVAKELPDFFNCILASSYYMSFAHAAQWFTNSETNDECHENARKTNDIKCHPPTIIIVDPATDEETDANTDVDSGSIDGERCRTFLRREIIGNQRMCWWCRPSFTDANTNARKGEIGKPTRKARDGRH